MTEAEGRRIDEGEEDVIADLAMLLAPTMRLDVRRQALVAVLGLSSPLDGSAEKAFTHKDYVLAKALCTLCETTISDRVQTLAALTNFLSVSAAAADFMLNQRQTTLKMAYESVTGRLGWADVAARLLANVTRHFPGESHTFLLALDSDLLTTLLGRVTESGEDRVSTLLGYCLVNFASLPRVRRQLVEKDGEGKIRIQPIYSILMQSVDGERRRIAADILRNCTFDDSLHAELLDTSDDFLVSVVTPLADSSDQLRQEETDSLPLSLQYYEGTRSKDGELRQKLVEALYQLCATRHGRTVLRERGIYPLLRELDKASQEGAREPAEKKMFSSDIIGEEHALHALIGVLIRYEEEMGISSSLPSIRELD